MEYLNGIFGEPIHVYSRANGIDDGFLVNLSIHFSNEINDIGIKVPTVCTRTFYEKFIKVPKIAACQDERGRLWDVLFMSKKSLIKASNDGNFLTPQYFQFYCSTNRRKPSLQKAKVVFDGEAFTYMMVNED